MKVTDLMLQAMQSPSRSSRTVCAGKSVECNLKRHPNKTYSRAPSVINKFHFRVAGRRSSRAAVDKLLTDNS